MDEEKTIYVVVAETVQTPLNVSFSSSGLEKLESTPFTKTVIQPSGRIAAQVGHVVSRMRIGELLTQGELPEKIAASKSLQDAQRICIDMYVQSSDVFRTIVFGVSDSFQLDFRQHLLEEKKIRCYSFFDTNDEYDSKVVKTAFCTQPVKYLETGRSLDYLRLWS